MKATIDPEGRIALDHDLQTFLGVQPGDDVVLEPRGAELVVKAADTRTGSAIRDHSAILAGYAAEDEGLYDDLASR